MVSVLVLLILTHFVIDIVFQPDFVAKHKSPLASIPQIPWYYVMGSHAASHGIGVFLVMDSVVLAVVETVIHFVIDVAKCRGLTNIHVDQVLHVVCKTAYVAIWWATGMAFRINN